MLAEREAIEKERDQRINDRFTELEAEVEALEKEGAKDADIKARQKAAEKDIVLTRETYEAELDMLDRIWDEFLDLFPRKHIEDEMLWSELQDRYGQYFEGGRDADA